MTKAPRARHRAVSAILAGVALLGVCGITAAAASLAPLVSGQLGARDATTQSCDTDGVAVSYTNSFDTTVAEYRTTAVTVSSIATTCFGQSLLVTVRSSTGAALWQGSTTVAATPTTLSTTPIVSSAIAGWAVSITG